MTYRIKMTVAYDGTNYAGFQVQDNAPTIQGEIERALKKMAKGEFIRIHGAGRTDSGVHAEKQVFHFDFPKNLPEKAFVKGLNSLTDDTIVFLKAEKVDEEFHSRYSAKGKKYQYKVDNNQSYSPFTRNYSFHHPHKLDQYKAEEALSYILGEHDFSSFCAANTAIKNKVRTITEASVEVDEETNEWIFTFRGNGFLYNMVRILMGTILEMADGRRDPKEMKTIIEAKNRELAGTTAPAHGLYMIEVYYDKDFEKNTSKS